MTRHTPEDQSYYDSVVSNLRNGDGSFLGSPEHVHKAEGSPPSKHPNADWAKTVDVPGRKRIPALLNAYYESQTNKTGPFSPALMRLLFEDLWGVEVEANRKAESEIEDLKNRHAQMELEAKERALKKTFIDARKAIETNENPEHVKALLDLTQNVLPEPIPEAVWPDTLEDRQVKEWVVPGWIPAGDITIITGDGECGKSTLALQLASAIACVDDMALQVIPGAYFNVEPPDSDWMPKDTIFISWEDTEDDVLEKLADHVSGVAWFSYNRFKNHVRFTDAIKEKFDPLYAPHARSTLASRGLETASYFRLRDMIDESTRLVVLDTLASCFIGEENSRSLSRDFLNALKRLVRGTQCALLLIAHPSKSSVVSGSTDWRNCPRSVIEMVHENGKRDIRHEKSNASTGKQQTITLHNEAPYFKYLHRDPIGTKKKTKKTANNGPR